MADPLLTVSYLMCHSLPPQPASPRFFPGFKVTEEEGWKKAKWYWNIYDTVSGRMPPKSHRFPTIIYSRMTG